MTLLSLTLALWALLGGCVGHAGAGEGPSPLATRYTQALPLAPEEGVFAYSRISPDGNYLSYASERHVGEKVVTLVNFIDLRRRRVLFSEPGFDSYWAPDGKRVIFLSAPAPDAHDVAIWHFDTGKVARHVVGPELGAYFTWARSAGRDLILTQFNRYFLLDGDRAQRPYYSVLPCPDIGTGEQPMVSRDGRLIATFVRDTLAVRTLEGCDTVIETHLPGGKADFSWDSRYIAFHTPKQGGRTKGYEIVVVDLETRRLVPVTDLPGSSYYPSWTKDGRLSFRYDSPEYRGFMMASGFLENPSRPLPASYKTATADAPSLGDLFRNAAKPAARVVLLNFWAGWCVHCRNELPVLERIRREIRARGLDAEIVGALEPSSFDSDRAHVTREEGISLPQVDIAPEDLTRFGVQMFPTTVMFVEGRLVERRYGSQSYEQFIGWLRQAGVLLGN